MTEQHTSRRRVQHPRVSVVIPTHNRADDLRRCLEALKTQTMVDFEVLICDDGSTDSTQNVAEEYCGVLDVVYDYSDNFGGPARPRNRGVRLARAPYIAFLDSDDWWMPEKLEISLSHLEQGADVVYHDLLVVTRSDAMLSRRRSPTRSLTAPAFDDLLVNGNALTNSSVVVRKSLIEEIGGFSEDPELIAAEDYDAWLRVARITEKFVRIPRALGYYWAGGAANISNPNRVIRSLSAFEKRYRSAIAEKSKAGSFYWIDYAKGRSHFRLREYASASKSLRRVRWPQAPFAIWIRSLAIVFWIRVWLKQ